MIFQMADLKSKLLERIVLFADRFSAVDLLSNQRNNSGPVVVWQAVEDRICNQIDLTSRVDLSDRQVVDALRLLLKIVRRNRLAIDFSRSEVLALKRGLQHSSGIATTCVARARIDVI